MRKGRNVHKYLIPSQTKSTYSPTPDLNCPKTSKRPSTPYNYTSALCKREEALEGSPKEDDSNQHLKPK